MRRKAQVIGVGGTILVVMIVIAAIVMMLLAAGIWRLKVTLQSSELTYSDNQLPTLQALSYSTIARVARAPVSFYELVAVAATTASVSVTAPAGGGATSIDVSGKLGSVLSRYSGETLLAFYPSCFEYRLDDAFRTNFFTRVLSGGFDPTDSCAHYAEGQKSLVETSRVNFIYFIPLPPYDGEARLTEQFIRMYVLMNAPKASCKQAGTDAANPAECCSGKMSGSVCSAS